MDCVSRKTHSVCGREPVRETGSNLGCGHDGVLVIWTATGIWRSRMGSVCNAPDGVVEMVTSSRRVVGSECESGNTILIGLRIVTGPFGHAPVISTRSVSCRWPCAVVSASETVNGRSRRNMTSSLTQTLSLNPRQVELPVLAWAYSEGKCASPV